MKRFAWLVILSALALLLTACATPAEPQVPDTTDSTAEQTTTTTTEEEATQPTETEKPADSTTAPTSATTADKKPSATKATTKKTTKKTTQPSDNQIDWEDVFGGDTTKDTTTSTTKKPTTTAPTKTTRKPQVVDKVTLPAVGTDVDGRGRIYLSEVTLKNGVVTLTLHNATDEQSQKWQTEETNYVTYACYDKNGNVLTGKGDYYGTFYIGALQAGEDVSTTFSLPAGTVKVELTGATIVYWTPWQ